MSSTFTNHSKRLLTEEECRSLANAALLVLAERAGGTLKLSSKDLMSVTLSVGEQGLAMSITDDDQWVLIGSAKRVFGGGA